MQVNTEDVTVPWGHAPDPLDVQMGRWRMAVFQDMQESLDISKLFFLYDPIADENSRTTGGRKGNQGLVVFDLYKRCFTKEIALYFEGSPKFIFALKCPSSSGGSSFVIATTSDKYGQPSLLLWRVNLTQDGLNLECAPRPLLSSSIPISDEFIIALREDAPEIIVLTAPGLTVWRINCLADEPCSPTESFSVPNAELSHYYDAYLSQGKIYFLSASPDGHFDPSRIHVLDITGQRQIYTQMCSPDPNRGTPCVRKQAAIDSISGYILLAGGEVDYGNSVTRLVDYWVLDLSNYTWQQIPSQMPVPLIEPRLTATNTGSLYLWGDFDQPLPGMPAGTHLRILRVSGFENMKPPPYDEALNKPTNPPYPSSRPYSTGPTYPSLGFTPGGGDAVNQPAYPIQESPFPSQNAPYQQNMEHPYGFQEQPGSAQPGNAFGGTGAQQSYAAQPYGQGQHAYYPPQENKSCCIQ